MWAEFWLAAIVGAVIVYVPAFAILRALRFSKIVSAAFAPVISLLFYSVLAIAYGKLGVLTDGWMLFVPLCIIAIAACIARFAFDCRYVAGSEDAPWSFAGFLKGAFDEQGRLILLYACVGVVVASYVFLMSLDSANSTTYAYDDQTHLGVVRSFVERGNYSSLGINYWVYDGEASGYYPAAWHMLCASVISICGVANYVGINAVMFIMASLVYPLSCLMAVRKIFPHDKNVQIAGSFLTLAFAAFPWGFFIYGRLAANLLAFCMLPAMLACTLYIFGKDESTRTRVAFAALLFVSFVLAVFTQPSVCFSWLYFSVPYLLYVLWNWKPEMAKTRKFMLVAGFCLAVIVFLIICYMLPFLRGLTRFKWPAAVTIPDAIGDVLFQSNQQSPASIILAILVICGIFFAARKSDKRWLVLLYAVFACLYVLDASTNLRLKNYVVGWWYTDSHRVLAMFAMVSYLLATLGLGRLVDVVSSRRDSFGFKRTLAFGMPAVALVLVLVPSFSLGTLSVQTPIGAMKGSIHGYYTLHMEDQAVLLSKPEYDFMQEASEVTGDDLVFNIPKDGSMFAYQSSGMKVLTPWSTDGVWRDDTNIRLLQRGFDDIATNSSVRRAAEALGIKYVLMLDQGHEPYHGFWGDYSNANWKGVLGIEEDTPGFELVMAQDDMKLYRVLSEEETEAQLRALEAE